MRQFTFRQFVKILKKNGFTEDCKRGKGDHRVFINSQGKHASIPYRSGKPLSLVITARLIKENKLIV